MSSLGLRLDDDTITISVCLRLRVALCRPHLCRQCGTPVDEYAMHGLSCSKSQGRHPRHSDLNDIIHRSLSTAGVPSQTKPHGLSRPDGKRPDGVTMLPWKNGHPLIWDATCSDTFAKSYLTISSGEARAVADLAETRKTALYNHLQTTHIFAPVSVETIGVFRQETLHFLKEIGQRLRNRTGDALSYRYLLQRLSIAIQRGNAASILGSLQPDIDITDNDFCV